MKQEIQSTLENIAARIKNPFIGAFVLCAFFQNWELVFMIFNFDIDCTLVDKIILIQSYVYKNTSNELWPWIKFFFLRPAFYAISLLVFYSIGRLVYTVILTIYYKHIEPFVIRRIQKGGYETIERYQELEKMNSSFISTINEYKEKYMLLVKDNSDTNSQLTGLKTEITENKEKLTRFESLKETLELFQNEEAAASNIKLSDVFRGEWLFISHNCP